MDTLVLAILLLSGVAILFVFSAFISHLFGLDNYYNDNMGKKIQNISGLNRVDKKEFSLDEKPGETAFNR